MAPIRCYTDWNKRPSDHEEEIEPFRKYIFICEGANTEPWYFHRLIDMRKQLNIHPMIDIRLWERTEEEKNISAPVRLIRFAEEKKHDKSLDFDPQHDKMVVIFDADIFEFRNPDYDRIVADGEKANIIGVTNPSFELFLLLHLDDAYERLIRPHEEELLENKKIGSQRYIQSFLRQECGMNPKRNEEIGGLAENVLHAIQEEKHLNQDIHKCHGQLTSNIGAIIETIMNDELN